MEPGLKGVDAGPRNAGMMFITLRIPIVVSVSNQTKLFEAALIIALDIQG